MTQWGYWKPVIKQWGNCLEGLNYLMGKREIGPLMAQWNTRGPFDDAMGKLETLAMGKLGAPDDLMGKLEALDHELFPYGLIRLHCNLFPNLWAQILIEKFYIHDMQAEKSILVFSVIYLDPWGYIWWALPVGPPFRYLKRFLLSFPFFLFFFICLSLSLSLGAPLVPGPLDIVHPCHPVATPLSVVCQNRESAGLFEYRLKIHSQFWIALARIYRSILPLC